MRGMKKWLSLFSLSFGATPAIGMAPVLWLQLRKQPFQKTAHSVAGDVKKVLGMRNRLHYFFVQLQLTRESHILLRTCRKYMG